MVACCQPSSLTNNKEIVVAASAGGLCDFQGEALSLLVGRIVRLLAGDSSISARMAQRSSVAEITGNRITSMQPRVRRHCRELNLRPAEAILEERHSQ